MAPLRALCAVVLSLQDMMAYISPRFWAVGHYLCFCCGAEFLSATVTQVAHSSGTCCTLSQLPVPQQPKGKRSACSYTPAPDVIVQQTFLFTNYRKRASGHLIWRSRRRDVVRLLRSPFSSGLRVWAGGQTSSHFQSKDGLRDVFFLCATTHHVVKGSISVLLPHTNLSDLSVFLAQDLLAMLQRRIHSNKHSNKHQHFLEGFELKPNWSIESPLITECFFLSSVGSK